MAYHREKLYQSYVASDIFHKDGRMSPERRLLDKKIRVRVKPKDLLEFRQDLAPEKLKTGKRFEEKKKTSSDIFFLQTDINENKLLSGNKTTKTILPSSDKAHNLSQTETKNKQRCDTEFYNRNEKKNQNDLITLYTEGNAKQIKVKPRIQWRTQHSIEHQNIEELTSRNRQLKSQRSNIFFNEKKDYPANLYKRQSSMDDKVFKHSKDVIQQNNASYLNKQWDNKMDWKICNTEILFKESNKAYRSMSAFERRLKENEGTLSSKTNIKSIYRSSLDCKNQLLNKNDCIDRQKRNNLLNAYTSNAAKISKQCESYNSTQGSQCVEKNTSCQFKKSMEKDCNKIETYQITNVNVMQEREIQRLMYKNGIHIFDIYRKNSISSGIPLLEFKIRENSNDETIEKKVKQIVSEINLSNEKDNIILVRQHNERRKESTKVTIPKELSRPSSSLRLK